MSNHPLRGWSTVDDEELRLLRELYAAARNDRYADHRLDEISGLNVRTATDAVTKFYSKKGE